MKQFVFTAILGFTSLISLNPASADNTVLCPDISQATKVMECPAESEIKRLFKKSCGFERDKDAVKPELCDSYAEFKRRKYTALWESSDGEFMGYVSCDALVEKVKMAKASGVAVFQKNGLYRVACKYQDGVALTMRTRKVCRIPGADKSSTVLRASCGADGKACKVECE